MSHNIYVITNLFITNNYLFEKQAFSNTPAMSMYLIEQSVKIKVGTLKIYVSAEAIRFTHCRDKQSNETCMPKHG